MHCYLKPQKKELHLISFSGQSFCLLRIISYLCLLIRPDSIFMAADMGRRIFLTDK